MCFQCTQDLIFNKALKVIYFRVVEYISKYVLFVALDLPPVIFIELCALKSKERHFGERMSCRELKSYGKT